MSSHHDRDPNGNEMLCEVPFDSDARGGRKGGWFCFFRLIDLHAIHFTLADLSQGVVRDSTHTDRVQRACCDPLRRQDRKLLFLPQPSTELPRISWPLFTSPKAHSRLLRCAQEGWRAFPGCPLIPQRLTASEGEVCPRPKRGGSPGRRLSSEDASAGAGLGPLLQGEQTSVQR